MGRFENTGWLVLPYIISESTTDATTATYDGWIAHMSLHQNQKRKLGKKILQGMPQDLHYGVRGSNETLPSQCTTTSNIFTVIQYLTSSLRPVLQNPIARSPEAPCFRTGLPTPRGRSPWWRPKKTIAQLLFIPQNSITTQFAMEIVKETH